MNVFKSILFFLSSSLIHKTEGQKASKLVWTADSNNVVRTAIGLSNYHYVLSSRDQGIYAEFMLRSDRNNGESDILDMVAGYYYPTWQSAKEAAQAHNDFVVAGRASLGINSRRIINPSQQPQSVPSVLLRRLLPTAAIAKACSAIDRLCQLLALVAKGEISIRTARFASRNQIDLLYTKDGKRTVSSLSRIVQDPDGYRNLSTIRTKAWVARSADGSVARQMVFVNAPGQLFGAIQTIRSDGRVSFACSSSVEDEFNAWKTASALLDAWKAEDYSVLGNMAHAAVTW